MHATLTPCAGAAKRLAAEIDAMLTPAEAAAILS